MTARQLWQIGPAQRIGSVTSHLTIVPVAQSGLDEQSSSTSQGLLDSNNREKSAYRSAACNPAYQTCAIASVWIGHLMVLGGVQGKKRERRSVPTGTVESTNTCHRLHGVTQNDDEKPHSRGPMQEQTLKALGCGTRRAVQTVST